MSTVTQQPEHSEAQNSEQRFVDEQIRRTRRALKLVDLAAGCITLVIAVLSYLLTMAMLEHWVVPGGLSPVVRAMLLIVLVAGVLAYAWRYFWPLISQPINPVYAAQTIEQGSPTLKNSLLNLLLLRGRRRQISRQVFQAIEHQAAQRLSQAPIDAAVDRSAILRLGYVLVAVVALCTLYRILSPKDPLTSAGRVLMPWAEIPVPSRVQILDVQPGDASVARGEQLAISAEILGQFADEPVRVVYSQSDGQVVDQEILMAADPEGLRYECRLPGRIGFGSTGGVKSDLTYHIEAGDARSSEYEVSVFSQPTLVVERIRYEYPAYTGYPAREIEFTGDISALEGTIVSIYAVANQPIESAHVDFEADGRHELLMAAEELNASVRFPLEFKEDRRTQKYSSYVLRYKTTEGRQNPAPPKYQIHVEADYAPEVEILEPAEAVKNVGLNEEVAIAVEARDPDFALHQVAIIGELAGRRVLKETLLTKDHTGRFTGRLKIVPAELNLREGDILEYWATAADNRSPEPNLGFTKRRKLRVVGGKEREPLPNGQQEDQPQQGQDSGGDQGAEGQQGDDGQGQGGGGQQGGQQQEGEQQQGAGGEGQQGEGEQGQQNGQQGDAGNSQNESSEGSQGEGAGGSSAEGGQNGEQDSGSEQQQGDSGGETTGANERVSSDGSNDSEAFERIAEHLKEKQQQESGGTEGNSGSEAQAAGEQDERGDAGQQPDAGSEGNQPEVGSEGQQPDSDPAQQGESRGDQSNQNGNQQDGSQENGNQAEQNPQEGQAGENEQQGEGQQQEGQQGSNDQQRNDGQQGAGQEQEGQQEGGQQQDNQSGEQSPEGQSPNEQGAQGAGDNPGENQGSPDADGMKKPNDKPSDTGQDPAENDQEAPAEAQNQRESDSEGSQGGDQSGGGQEGAGQQSDADGTGSSGEHQSAEDGGGQSTETGQGETGEEAGSQEQAPGETGESSGDQPGEGSQQSQQQGDKPGGEQEGSAKEGQSSDNPSNSSGSPEQGGTGGANSPPPPGELQPGDEANLEYARKQTDLVLNTLEEQLKQKQVDQELLDKLGWTPDELRRFVDRWKNLKREAEGAGPNAAQANEELNAALQSLGLTPNRRSGFNARNAKDRLRDLRDAYRGRTPVEYQEQIRKYVKGTAAAEDQ